MVTKAMGPPWTDGTRVLVRDLSSHLERWDPILRVPLGVDWRPDRGRVERLPVLGVSGHASGWTERGALLARLVTGGREAVRHFVFAPTRATALAARASRRVRRIPIVQTIPSRPRVFDAGLAFGDRVVVPSRWSEARWRQAGVEAPRLRRVPPGVPLPDAVDDAARRRARRALGWPEDAPTVLYPGDLGGDAPRVVDAFADAAPPPARLVLASRRKSPADDESGAALVRRIQRRDLDDRVVWTGEVPRFASLLEAADVVALPALDTYAKVDLPLALLEAMALGLPVVVDARGPAAELAVDGGAWAVRDDGELVEALRALVADGALRRRYGEAGRRTIARDFDPATVAGRYEALYDEVCR